MRLFFRYVDDIIKTVNGGPKKLLQAANGIHPHLQFTVEPTNSAGYLDFLDLEINIDKDMRMSCGWY